MLQKYRVAATEVHGSHRPFRELAVTDYLPAAAVPSALPHLQTSRSAQAKVTLLQAVPHP